MLKLFVILVCLSVAFATANVTTPPPTPSPTQPHGNFSLMNTKTKKYCLLAEFAATFTINYLAKVHEGKNKTKTMNKTATIYLNRTNEHDVNITGVCGGDKIPAKLMLTWPMKEHFYTLTMEFSKMTKALEASDNTSTSWAGQKISFLATLLGNKDFPNATEPSISSSHNSSAGLSGKVGGYYSCYSKTEMMLNTSVKTDFQDLKLEPFVSKNTSDDFGKDAKQCPQDNTNGTTTASPITNTTTTAKPATNGTTTVKPSTNGTTTTPAPTPSPAPPPPHGNFSLMNNKTKKYCLLAEFAATFTIKYLVIAYKNNTSNTTKKKETGIIYLNRTNEHDVRIGGDCGVNKSLATLSLTWPKKEPFYTLTMEFGKVAKVLEASGKTSTWAVKMISLRVGLKGNEDFPNATEPNITSTYTGSAGPSGKVGGYYSCRSKSGLTLKTGLEDYSVDADLQDLKVEPFVSKSTSNDFGKDAKECYNDNPTKATTEAPDNDIVPIAVGCALAGLVLIVLIAYIIGRRKSHRGYEKV